MSFCFLLFLPLFSLPLPSLSLLLPSLFSPPSFSFSPYRQHYEQAVNTISLTIHPSSYYVYANGALQNVMVMRGEVNERREWTELALYYGQILYKVKYFVGLFAVVMEHVGNEMTM